MFFFCSWFGVAVRPLIKLKPLLILFIFLLNSFCLWEETQPILIPKIKVLLDNIDGVQTVKNVKITNKTGTNAGYSSHAYDVLGATQNEIVYPSIDPSIFEVKYPDQDITGRVVIQ